MKKIMPALAAPGMTSTARVSSICRFVTTMKLVRRIVMPGMNIVVMTMTHSVRLNRKSRRAKAYAASELTVRASTVNSTAPRNVHSIVRVNVGSARICA